jgi:hypothetical protein
MTDRTVPKVRAFTETLDDGCRARPTDSAEGAGAVGDELVGVDP